MKSLVTELSYEAYTDRQEQQITPDAIRNSLNKLKRGNKFTFETGQWQGLDYEGYAVVSMLNKNPGNEPLGIMLDLIVAELKKVMSSDDFFFLPKESYHQTMANTLSAARFYENVKDKDLEDVYPQLIQKAFEEIDDVQGATAVPMKINGLSVFGSSFGVLGTFENQEDLHRIIAFRDNFYSKSFLNDLDVKRTRPFIGHVTLGYFENDVMISDEAKEKIAETIDRINEEIKERELVFYFSNTELRKYYELSEFTTQDNYPKFSFLK